MQVKKPSNALQLAESKLTGFSKEKKVIGVKEVERKVNLSAEMSNPPMRYAYKQPLSGLGQDLNHTNDSVGAKFAINTDLLPSGKDQNVVGSGGRASV